MRAAHELGLAVLADVAVVGFDDGELAKALDLTTLRQPLEESGRTAMELLFQRLDWPGTVRKVALRLELVVRGSG
jgi:LacI family transcriptional regulator